MSRIAKLLNLMLLGWVLGISARAQTMLATPESFTNWLKLPRPAQIACPMPRPNNLPPFVFKIENVDAKLLPFTAGFELRQFFVGSRDVQMHFVNSAGESADFLFHVEDFRFRNRGDFEFPTEVVYRLHGMREEAIASLNCRVKI